MRRAIELARNNPRLPFGAVIVDTRTHAILAEGWNHDDRGPIWHGEIDALHILATHHPRCDGSYLTLYTTAEPCPMCQAAILWAGLGAVIYDTSIPTLVRLGWKQIDIRAEEVTRRTPFARCTLIGGVLEAECDPLFVTARGLLDLPASGQAEKP
jgi:tRNA(Arg) A34 adenosine deaminase TadA